MSRAPEATKSAEALGAPCIDDLRRVEIFGDLEEEQLQWLLDRATCLDLATGESLWAQGQPANAMFVLLRGKVQLIFDVMGQSLRATSERWGGVVGVLPYSRMTEYAAPCVAIEPCRVLRIGKEHFIEMLSTIPELGYRLVALMSDRVREGTRVQEQREKMMALGKLSAGLAHELNNPSAAIGRAAADLSARLRESNRRVLAIAGHGLSLEQMQAVISLRDLGSGNGGTLSTLERGRREDELADWLDELEIEDGWVLAEALVEAGLDLERLQSACEGLPSAAMGDVLAWIESGLAARQLLDQVGTAAERITELVHAVKAYSHMDQSPDQQVVDVHQGIDQTLTILGHKLRAKNLTVERRFGSDVPEVPLYPSEINQVWTNLLDNAIDAVESGGLLAVETSADLCSVFVTVVDNGPGISEDDQKRIFEPFFTTKPVGEGTGLGLDIVHRIVLQHQGEVDLASEPGRTAFTVRLPREGKKGEK